MNRPTTAADLRAFQAPAFYDAASGSILVRPKALDCDVVSSLHGIVGGYSQDSPHLNEKMRYFGYMRNSSHTKISPAVNSLVKKSPEIYAKSNKIPSQSLFMLANGYRSTGFEIIRGAIVIS
jgi:hypothetical protein